MLRACEERGIAYLPYSPFGGGDRATGLGDIAAVATIAQRHGATPYQVVLAWLLATSPVIVPIPCTTRPERVRDNLAATGVTLSPDDLRALDAATPPA